MCKHVVLLTAYTGDKSTGNNLSGNGPYFPKKYTYCVVLCSSLCSELVLKTCAGKRKPSFLQPMRLQRKLKTMSLGGKERTFWTRRWFLPGDKNNNCYFSWCFFPTEFALVFAGEITPDIYNQYPGSVCLWQCFRINLSILLVGYITCAKWHNCVQADCNPSLQSPRRKQNNLRVDKYYIFFQSLQWITKKVFAYIVFSLYDQLHFH